MSDRIVVPDLIRMRRQGKKIVMLTAYDFTSANLIDAAGLMLSLWEILLLLLFRALRPHFQ